MPERRERELADERERAGGAAAVTGAAAATVALAAAHAVVPELPLPPVVVAEAILRATPGDVATFFIEVLGGLAQPLLILATTAGFLAATWLLGRAISRLEPRVNGGVAVAAALLSSPLAITAFVVGAIADAPAGRLTISLVLGLAIGVAVTSWRFARLTRPPHPERPNAPGLHRREVIRATWATGAGVILAWTGLGRMALGGDRPEDGRLRVRARELFPDPPPADAELEAIGRLVPRRTPTADFYTIDTALIDPVVDAGSWRLEIGGLVGRRSELTYDELEALPAVTFDSTLVCISNEVGGDLISSGRWVGIPLRTLLERTGVGDGVVEVVSTSVDGYADSIPLDVAMRDTSIVAIGLNGRPLPTAHGFPARLLVPGRYGMKQPKWLRSIELVDRPIEGYWEQRGWSKAAIVKTMSRIDAATDGASEGVVVAGVAFAGDRRITRIEVSPDGGDSWIDAELEVPLSPLTWRRWRAELPAETRSVTVRGTDGDGAVQTQEIAAPHPDGSSGYDSVTL